MRKILILGAGTGGTIMANNLRRTLSPKEWKITIADREKDHYYQPGSVDCIWGDRLAGARALCPCAH